MESNLDHSLDEDEEVMEDTTLHTRRVTSLDSVRKVVNLSVEFDPVTFIPLGKPGNKYTSWVGLETRSKISILVSDWKTVDKSLKDHLWLSIQSPEHVTNAILNAFGAPHNKNKVFFLAPYTQGGHWVLLLVLPKPRMVYVLDASHLDTGKKPESYHIKPLIDSAITMCDLSANVSSQWVTWVMVKCNQQKNTWECGYYVCKWLFHFVVEQQYSFPQQNP
nr:uncharacterized protein LOC122598485 isoform X2 [Erigeron canadensis]XP_043627014.1 uncharacterized protein LOC122598485 isoform X2 [Erigeron canadensis]